MTIMKQARAWMISMALTASCAEMAPAGEEGLGDHGELEDKGPQTSNGLTTVNGVTTINGLPTLNGLSTINGLITVNGLTSTNGLKVINGLQTINGLATKFGQTTVNGKWINCYGKTNSTCDAPDGLLSYKTGLMRNQLGLDMAGYLVRCALPSDRYLKIRRWDTNFVTIRGEAGLTPEWETGQCDAACQEKITACLLAHVNGSGAHISLEMSAANMPTLGAGHSLPYAEAVFYGNIFVDPPQAYVAAHNDYAYVLYNASLGGTTFNKFLMARSCSNLSALTFAQFVTNQSSCPIKITGAVRQYGWVGADTSKCGIGPSTDGMRGVALACSGPNSTVRSWLYPITTYRGSDLLY